MEWSTEQEDAARKKVQENSEPLPEEKQGLFVCDVQLKYAVQCFVILYLKLQQSNASFSQM